MFRIKPQAYILLAVAMLLFPIRWILSWVLAASIHEVFHCFAIWATGGCIYQIQIGAFGARIETDGSSLGKEAVRALAGPIGGLLLLLTVRFAPRLAICGCVQSLCNLAPIYPLDGSRVILSVLHKFTPKYAEKITNILGVMVSGCLFFVGIYGAAAWKYGLLPLGFSIVLLYRAIKNSLQSKCIKSTIALPDY